MSELVRCLACDGYGFVDASDLAPGSPERVTRDSCVCRYCNGKGTRSAEARTLPEVPPLKTPWIAGARGYWVAELDPAGLVADPVIRDIKIKSVGKVLLVRHGLGPRGMKQYLMRDGEPVTHPNGAVVLFRTPTEAVAAFRVEQEEQARRYRSLADAAAKRGRWAVAWLKDRWL